MEEASTTGRTTAEADEQRVSLGMRAQRTTDGSGEVFFTSELSLR